MTTNFEPHECVIFVQSTKIGTHEIKAIHSILALGASLQNQLSDLKVKVETCSINLFQVPYTLFL